MLKYFPLPNAHEVAKGRCCTACIPTRFRISSGRSSPRSETVDLANYRSLPIPYILSSSHSNVIHIIFTRTLLQVCRNVLLKLDLDSERRMMSRTTRDEPNDRWDFCSSTFRSRNELSVHLQQLHVAHDKAEEVYCKRRRISRGVYMVLEGNRLAGESVGNSVKSSPCPGTAGSVAHAVSPQR
jgi:hypothetical protein